MALVVPDVGEVAFLESLRGYFNGSAAMNLRLFQNNYAPVHGSVIGDFTVATFSGYSPVAITDFGAASTVANKAKIVCAAAKVFSHSGGGTSNTIYGYYVVNMAGTLVYFAEKFSAPIVMASSGDSISITPEMTLFSEN